MTGEFFQRLGQRWWPEHSRLRNEATPLVLNLVFSLSSYTKEHLLMQTPSSHPEVLSALQAQAEAQGKQCCVGALILNQQGHLLVHRRAPERKLFPNCWDIIGGHVEPGETLTAALAREIREETGWELSRIITLFNVFEWEAEPKGPRREFDFIVEVEGNLEHPQLEWTKHTAFRWVGLDELELLKEERLAGDDELYQMAKRVLEWR
jgi:8-oxo-dGTP diphosphatase